MLFISGVPMNDMNSMKNCSGGFKVGQINKPTRYVNLQ